VIINEYNNEISVDSISNKFDFGSVICTTL
jgi:hypothetical protein